MCVTLFCSLSPPLWACEPLPARLILRISSSSLSSFRELPASRCGTTKQLVVGRQRHIQRQNRLPPHAESERKTLLSGALERRQRRSDRGQVFLLRCVCVEAGQERLVLLTCCLRATTRSGRLPAVAAMQRRDDAVMIHLVLRKLMHDT